MARFQIGEYLSAKDNRHKAVLRELESHRKCRFFAEFHAKYKERFELSDASPFEGASKPLRSKEKEKETEKETPPNPPQAGDGCAADESASPKKRKPKATKQSPEAHPLFGQFWAAYPRKVAKPNAAKAFVKINPDEALLAKMLAAITQHAKSEQWLKDDGAFIPHPATWLNGRRWEDEPTKAATPKPEHRVGLDANLMQRQPPKEQS